MRVFMVALALVIAPLAAGVSQDPGASAGKGVGPAYGRDGSRGRGHDAAHCAMRAAKDASGDINKCVSQDPPPPPPPASCGSVPAPAGASGVTGKVYTVAADGSTVPLANWCVTVSGTVNAGVATDALGNYSIMGLPDGTYTVCEVVQAGWVQTSPTGGSACSTGVGYSFNLTGGQIGSFLYFRNMPATP